MSQTINLIIPMFHFEYSLYLVTKILQTLCVSFKSKHNEFHLKLYIYNTILLGSLINVKTPWRPADQSHDLFGNLVLLRTETLTSHE